MINDRAETVAEKPAFRRAVGGRPLFPLLPPMAREWQQQPGEAKPAESNQPGLMAARWRSPGSTSLAGPSDAARRR